MQNQSDDIDKIGQESTAKAQEETKSAEFIPQASNVEEREKITDYVKRLFTDSEDEMQSYSSSTTMTTPRKRQQAEEYDVQRMSSAQKFFQTPMSGVRRKYDLASAISFGGAQSERRQNRISFH